MKVESFSVHSPLLTGEHVFNVFFLVDFTGFHPISPVLSNFHLSMWCQALRALAF